MKLTAHEIRVLEMLDGRRQGSWGAWVSACLESLVGMGCAQQHGTRYSITEAGRRALAEGGERRPPVEREGEDPGINHDLLEAVFGAGGGDA